MAFCNKVKLHKADAQIALKRALRLCKQIKRRKEKRIYQCPRCNWWHLTSKDEDEIGPSQPIIPIEKDRWERLLANH